MGEPPVSVVWVEDSDADYCAGCSAAFTFTLRKHMCRMCGAGFCARCSASKRPVPWRGHYDPVRVCDMCVQAADRTKKRERMKKALGEADGDQYGDTGNFRDAEEMRRREQNANFLEALKRIYNAKIRPLEQAYRFGEFYNSELTEGDFDSRPMVLLVGQYSVGKTSFIRYLLERDFPGQRIGPEPTTDRFMAIMGGNGDRIIPGNAAGVDPRRPFSTLERFGTAFLNRFEVAEMSAPILDALYFVDTPGILSGEKQRLDRGYSFEAVVQWFAERADRILVLFDAHKLDISDELKRTLQVLKPHEEKIRVVLNKADLIDAQQLMRVYGALMWSLGKVIKSPEVMRVYMGSFWDEPLAPTGQHNSELFAAEKQDLISDLRSLPRNSAIRKVNELVKRARLAKVHALLLSYLRGNMPYLWGHQKKHKKLVERLDNEYNKVAKMHDLALGDFPSMEKFRAGLDRFEISDFPSLNPRLVDVANVALSRDVPNLILQMQSAQAKNARSNQQATFRATSNTNNKDEMPFVDARLARMALHERNAPAPLVRDMETMPWSPVDDSQQTQKENPFMEVFGGSGGEKSVPDSDPTWIVSDADRQKWHGKFYDLRPAGKPPLLAGSQVRPLMMESRLHTDCLRKIWDLCDVEGRGALDPDEFALTMYLIEMAKREGASSLPDALSEIFLPPGRR